MYALTGDWPDIYKNILSTIKEKGEFQGKSKCIYNLSFKINPDQVLILPKKNWKWAFIELYDRLNQNYSNPGNSYNFRSNWKKKLENEGGLFVYNYHDRISDQLNQVINQLSSSKLSRQAVLTIYNREDCLYYKSLSRTPCTTTLQFFITKDKKLNLSVNMRANDVVNLLFHDVFHHSILQRLIASRLNLEIGFYHHNCTIAYYQKKREIRGYIDRFLAEDLKYYNFTTTNSFYQEMMLAVSYPLDFTLDLSNSFVKDFNKVVQVLLYNKTNIQYQLEFFKEIMNGG